MNDRVTTMLDNLFAFELTAHLLRHDFVQQALVAGALLGLVAGLIGPFIVMRQMSFAVHGSSELSLTGAAFALLAGFQVGVGALVGSALAGLPQAQQQAIELAYYEGLTHNEIAAKLNQPLGTVKTRIKLGMSKLRDTLRHCWEQGDLG